MRPTTHPAIANTGGTVFGLVVAYGVGSAVQQRLHERGYSLWQQSLYTGGAAAGFGWGATWVGSKVTGHLAAKFLPSLAGVTPAATNATGTAATQAAKKGIVQGVVQATEGRLGQVLNFVSKTPKGAGVFGAVLAVVPDTVAGVRQAINGDSAAAKSSFKRAAVRGVVVGLCTGLGFLAGGGVASAATATVGAIGGSVLADQIVARFGL